MAVLKRIHLTKADLDRIPADERFFYLMAGHFGNDVNILGKLVIVAFNTAYKDGLILKDEPHGQAGLAQLFLLLKLLAGRLYEASRLIDAHYFAKGLHKKYESPMSETAREPRRKFSAYFGNKSNVISRVRQKVAFHFDRKTQVIAACLKEEGYGGILYRSGLSHDGINYALFDPSVADVVDVRLYVVTDINVEAKVYTGTVSI